MAIQQLQKMQQQWQHPSQRARAADTATKWLSAATAAYISSRRPQEDNFSVFFSVDASRGPRSPSSSWGCKLAGSLLLVLLLFRRASILRRSPMPLLHCLLQLLLLLLLLLLLGVFFQCVWPGAFSPRLRVLLFYEICGRQWAIKRP